MGAGRRMARETSSARRQGEEAEAERAAAFLGGELDLAWV
jgi:hypothetical protein